MFCKYDMFLKSECCGMEETHLRYSSMVTSLALYNFLKYPYLLADASLADSPVLQPDTEVSSKEVQIV